MRLALGAQRADIRTLIFGHGLRLLSGGLLAGVAGAVACSRLLRTFLFGVNALDLPIYLGVSALLALVALLACWIPARRASQVDPMITLRAE